MRTMAGVMVAALMAAVGCGGASGGQTVEFASSPGDGGAVAACVPFACQMIDGKLSAFATVSPAETDSLSAHCAGAASCNDVTAADPVCVTYVTTGGLLLSMYACPVECCR